MSTTKSRIAYLDGWRVIAIALVLLDHLSNNHAIAAFYERNGLRFLADYGEVGVFIFFFISGRVVGAGCLAELERTGRFDVTAFYIRRLFRIAPPLMLYLSFCFWLGLRGAIDFTPANFFSATFFLCNSAAPLVSCNWYAGHTWSLAFEAQFYMLFPPVLLWLERRVAPSLSAAILLAPLIALPFLFPIWWIGASGAVIAYALFFAGYLAAKNPDSAEAPGRWRLRALFLAAAIVLLPRTAIASLGDSENMRALLIDAYRPLYIVAVPALVTLTGAAGPLTQRLLAANWLSALGRATYSIYLWQQLVTGALFADVDAATQLAMLAGAIGLCLPLYSLWETKLIELGRRLAARRARPAMADASA